MENEKNTTTVIIDAFQAAVEAPCLICGEGVPVFGSYYAPKVCEKCKAAVMKVREQDGN
jgi:uncharacterized protein (DUF983 family)